MLTFEKKNGWIERLPGLPRALKSRWRASLEVRDGLRQEPFDATFIAVHSALASRADYLRRNACFMTFDVTPKQLHAFGDFYGKHLSRFAVVEQWKHARRIIAYQECRGLFPWSNWAARSAIEDYGAKPERVNVLPPGVNLDRWMPGDAAAKAKKAVCDLLFVGGDFERKGGNLLLDWARRTNLTGWRLHLVTRDKVPISDERVKVYNGLSSNDPALTALYKEADAFVLPTKADCYSIAGIEAMASGLPIILSETGGTGDVVKNGETGFLLRGGESELDTALTALISNPTRRREMGVAARADAECRYDVKKNIRRALDVMEANLAP